MSIGTQLSGNQDLAASRTDVRHASLLSLMLAVVAVGK
jgi:hypothetical protein